MTGRRLAWAVVALVDIVVVLYVVQLALSGASLPWEQPAPAPWAGGPPQAESAWGLGLIPVGPVDQQPAETAWPSDSGPVANRDAFLLTYDPDWWGGVWDQYGRVDGYQTVLWSNSTSCRGVVSRIHRFDGIREAQLGFLRLADEFTALQETAGFNDAVVTGPHETTIPGLAVEAVQQTFYLAIAGRDPYYVTWITFRRGAFVGVVQVTQPRSLDNRHGTDAAMALARTMDQRIAAAVGTAEDWTAIDIPGPDPDAEKGCGR